MAKKKGDSRSSDSRADERFRWRLDHSFFMIVLVALVALAGVYTLYISQSINSTPTPPEFYIMEYLEEVNAEETGLTGMVVAGEEAPEEIRSILTNEPPSHFRYRTYYGCYKRCVCSGAMTCKCMYGGCIKVNS